MKKKFKYLGISLLLLAVIMLGLFIYGNRDDVLVEANQNMRLVVDSSKRRVAIPKAPKRVIILNASNVEIFCAVGGKLVGKAQSPSYPDYLQDTISTIPEVGMIHIPNLERIIALKPDLVIGTNIPFHSALQGPLKAAGIPLFINSIDSYQDVLRTIELFGSISGNQELATKKAAAVDEQYNKALRMANTGNPPRTLIIWGSPESFNMATRYSFSGDLLKSLGGINITDADSSWRSSYVPLSMEYLTQQDPELILVITMGENSAQVMEKLKQNIQTNAVWQSLNAVQNGRVYHLPPKLFTVNPGTQVAEAALIIAKYLYPKTEKENDDV